MLVQTKKEILQKWVKALKSGKYVQGVNKLRSNKDEFCCLGVLCDVYAKECNGGRWEDQTYYGLKTFVITDNSESDAYSLPNGLSKALGIDSKFESRLIDMNDEEGADFIQIAEFIESELLR